MQPGLELRWLTQEPELTAERIGRRLLLQASGDTVVFDGLGLRFVREAGVRAEGRLALVPAVVAVAAGGALPTASAAAKSRLRLAALGGATVEIDRTVRDFAAALDVAGDGEMAPPEPFLGATVRVLRDPRLPGALLALLEPNTEGRLAATLARDGEGPCALYLAPDDSLDAWLGRARTGGVAGSRPDQGPFGWSSLVLGGPVAGPHLVVVDPARDGR